MFKYAHLKFQVVIVLCGVGVSTPENVKLNLTKTCLEVCNRLEGNSLSKENYLHKPSTCIRAHVDLRDNYSPGWKFNHWELKVFIFFELLIYHLIILI